MSLRYEYRRALDASDTALALTGELSHGLSRPRQADTPALAALMLSAYRGTADSSDETEDDRCARSRTTSARPHSRRCPSAPGCCGTPALRWGHVSAPGGSDAVRR
jgi:hypothetical protein